MGTDHWSPTGGTPSPAPDEGVLPAVVRSRSDGTERYICYAADVDPSDVETQWISVDADIPVSLRVWR
ncbi:MULTISPECIES: DUF7511 domain-containing protein [Haloarcula]|uniref:DUF7511 domain-containing protein n=1 Tax=Haloarcula pellucida TaxID=1427151 RepID=A0A830GR26_9EURY|nr:MULTISPECIES: hypothetical protein [Halomicroarcula]MBX0349318.1 hypothetical protein [Halomicroarcula pellucida]MDS0279096.1 hypothetical protein [Halomicroarcula sp. S1AR25-4]QIO21467.1 hypothetical protein G9465_03490 [Haloarcula sp. JP-L23]GGO00013.1 hypothetical protein GCM10009030_32230 [Halomicroarcula pellucida]